MTVVIDINRSTTKELVQRPGRHRWRFRLGRTIWQCCWDVKRLGSIEIIQVLYFVGGGEGRRGREGGRIISGLTKDDRTVNMELEYFHSSGSNRPGKEENQNPHWIQNRILCLPLLFFLSFFFQYSNSSPLLHVLLFFFFLLWWLLFVISFLLIAGICGGMFIAPRPSGNRPMRAVASFQPRHVAHLIHLDSASKIPFDWWITIICLFSFSFIFEFILIWIFDPISYSSPQIREQKIVMNNDSNYSYSENVSRFRFGVDFRLRFFPDLSPTIDFDSCWNRPLGHFVSFLRHVFNSKKKIMIFF